MKAGQKIVSNEEAPIETGNRLPLKNIPIGSTIHAIEMQPGKVLRWYAVLATAHN